ncbi:MAG TPA: bestrophin family ion channel [Isosphaeraceae bacterium]|jgi:putative membrane protein|nr:bestrophin family ion channel [Isosphaeraceae bacterium]
MKPLPAHNFWVDAVALRGAATLIVLPRVVAFGVVAGLIVVADIVTPAHINLGIEPTPIGVAGTILGLLLVLRVNTGYDRWWEARKLWGGIINQSRNLAIAAIAFGPGDPRWRDGMARAVAAFAHATRASLRDEPMAPEAIELLGADDAGRVGDAAHAPSAVALILAERLRDGRDRLGMDPFGFLRADRERALLLDHCGGCDRIKRSPLTRAMTILIRRFIVLYLITLPFALLHSFGRSWLVPAATMLVAYPVLALDQVAFEIQNPFRPQSLDRLYLDEFCRTIERDVFALLALGRPPGADGLDGAPRAPSLEFDIDTL